MAQICVVGLNAGKFENLGGSNDSGGLIVQPSGSTSPGLEIQQLGASSALAISHGSANGMSIYIEHDSSQPAIQVNQNQSGVAFAASLSGSISQGLVITDNDGSTLPLLEVDGSGTGAGVSVSHSGSGIAMSLVKSGSTGIGLYVDYKNASTGDPGIQVDYGGTGYGLYVNYTNVNSANPGIQVSHNGTGDGVYVNQSGNGNVMSLIKSGGTGVGLYVICANPSAGNPGIQVNYSGTGVGMKITQGSGSSSAISIIMSGSAFGIGMTQSGDGGGISFTTTGIGNGYHAYMNPNSSSATQYGVDVAGGPKFTGYCFYGKTSAGGGASYTIGSSCSNHGLYINYSGSGHGIAIDLYGGNYGTAGLLVNMESATHAYGIYVNNNLGATTALEPIYILNGNTSSSNGMFIEHMSNASGKYGLFVNVFAGGGIYLYDENTTQNAPSLSIYNNTAAGNVTPGINLTMDTGSDSTGILITKGGSGYGLRVASSCGGQINGANAAGYFSISGSSGSFTPSYCLFVTSTATGSGATHCVYINNASTTTGTKYGLYVAAGLSYFGADLYVPNMTSAAGTNYVKWTTGSGQLTQSASDERIKTNIVDYAGGLDKIVALTPRDFTFRGATIKDGVITFHDELTQDHVVGLVAQEVVKTMPEAVYQPADPDNNFWSVDYEKIIPALINAVKTLKGNYDNLLASFNAYVTAHP
jgi:hypothetical protein